MRRGLQIEPQRKRACGCAWYESRKEGRRDPWPTVEGALPLFLESVGVFLAPMDPGWHQESLSRTMLHPHL